MTESGEVRSLIERLLAAVSVPSSDEDAHRHHELVEGTRFQLGKALRVEPGWTAARVDAVFAIILLDSGMTNELVEPLVDTLGARAALARLTAAIGNPELSQRQWAGATAAAYWVRCWRPRVQRELPRAAFAAGARTATEIDEYIRSHGQPPSPGDAITDLWPRFWRECLSTFISCDDTDIRRSLHTAFPLDPNCYPPECAAELRAATDIARADPRTFGRLLDGSTGFGHRI